MENSIPISFAQAVREYILDVYDKECLKMMTQAQQDILTELEFEEYAAPVIAQFMGALYTFDRPKFQILFKPIFDEYKIKKENDDALCNRNMLRLVEKEKHS